MWTETSWSFTFLSALALVLSLACFDQIILDQAPPDSVDATAQKIAKVRTVNLFAANKEISNALKNEICGIRNLNLRALEMTFDQIVSGRSLLTTAAQIRRLYAEIEADQILLHRSPKRPGFPSGRLVRALCGRFRGLEQGREGNWN